jgi:hypothetical protein
LGNFGLTILIVLNSPSHSIYFFLFVIHRPLSFFCDNTQNADEIHIKQECYFLHGMYDQLYFLFFFFPFWMLCADINGLWLLCDHLQFSVV